MQWFKHQTNSLSQREMQLILDKFGLWGIGAYWSLVELYFANIKKGETKVLIHNRLATNNLRIKQKKLDEFLSFCNVETSLKTRGYQESTEFFLPKYLKSLESQSTDIDIDIDKEKEKKKNEIADASVVAFFLNFYPVPTSESDINAAIQELSEDDRLDLRLAIQNYREYLKAGNIEPRFVKKFTTFMQEWQQWVDYKVAPKRQLRM